MGENRDRAPNGHLGVAVLANRDGHRVPYGRHILSLTAEFICAAVEQRTDPSRRRCAEGHGNYVLNPIDTQTP